MYRGKRRARRAAWPGASQLLPECGRSPVRGPSWKCRRLAAKTMV